MELIVIYLDKNLYKYSEGGFFMLPIIANPHLSTFHPSNTIINPQGPKDSFSTLFYLG